jgi:predicted acylesterase/phospholipase RssA
VGKLALVLSGGGARGAFQAGALHELLGYFERTGKRINILSGTSVGALNGMGIAQAESYPQAADELEARWRATTNDDVYKVRKWDLFRLFLRFTVTPMDRWAFVPGSDSIFDNTPLYRSYAEGYLDLGKIHARRTVDDFLVSLCSLNTGEAYLKSLTTETDLRRARDYLMASTITTVAYPPVRLVVHDPGVPEHLRLLPQLYADGGISNKTPLKTIFHAGDISELYVVNTYPSYPNKTEASIRQVFPNLFAMLMRTALELLPNLYFLRDMQTVRDVNNDLRVWGETRRTLLEAAPDAATRAKVEEVLREAEGRLSFKQGGKHIIEPVVIAPDEELPVLDTEFVQPKLMETFAMGGEKARAVIAALEGKAQVPAGVSRRAVS